MSTASTWAGIASYAALAIALSCLGRACRSGGLLPGWLGVVAYAGAAILVGMIVRSQLSGADGVMTRSHDGIEWPADTRSQSTRTWNRPASLRVTLATRI